LQPASGVPRSGDLVIRDLRLFALAALAACLGPLGLASAADPQQLAPPRVEVLRAASWPGEMMQAFQQGLPDAGYTEGRDVVRDWR
jgi:hypothetical protein